MTRSGVALVLASVIATMPNISAAVSAPSSERNSVRHTVSLSTANEEDPTAGPTPLEECVNAAVEQEAEAWVCMGNMLSVAPADDAANKKWKTRRIGSARVQATEGTSARSGTGEYYDNWCENGSICTKTITDYISETKGNGAYGDSDGAIGSFDQILRTELNGRSQRLRGTWYWDSGPAVEFKQMQILRYQDEFGPDDVVGRWFPDLNENGAFTVSTNDRKDTGRLINTAPLADDGDYFAAIQGTFVARGIGYRLGQLRGENWKCRRSSSPDCYFP